MAIKNVVNLAVQKIGGPTCAGIALKTNPQTVHQWIRKGYVPKYEMASQLATLSGYQIEDLRPLATVISINGGSV